MPLNALRIRKPKADENATNPKLKAKVGRGKAVVKQEAPAKGRLALTEIGKNRILNKPLRIGKEKVGPTEGCSQKSEECTQKSEECTQKSEECTQKSEECNQKSEDCSQKSEDCSQKSLGTRGVSSQESIKKEPEAVPAAKKQRLSESPEIKAVEQPASSSPQVVESSELVPFDFATMYQLANSEDYAFLVPKGNFQERAYELTDYVLHIFKNEQDKELLPKNRIRDFLGEGMQEELSAGVLATLVDWLVEVQENYELNHETLYLAWSLVYDYLGRVEQVEKSQIQLIACAAIWVSAKYEERQPPSIDNLNFITGYNYDEPQFIAAEQKLLNTIGFNLYRPNAYVFLRRYSRVLDMKNTELQYMSRFILEASMHHHASMVERESKRAATALYLARAVMNVSNKGVDGVPRTWPVILTRLTRYRESTLAAAASLLHNHVLRMIGKAEHVERGTHPAHTTYTRTVDKYKNEVFLYVASHYTQLAERNLRTVLQKALTTN